MKHCILLLLIALSCSLMAQSDAPIIGRSSEVSTDISGLFFNRLRVDYNHRFRAKMAFSAGLRTRPQDANIEVNDIPGMPFASRTKTIDDAVRSLDARVGVRWYLGTLPENGFWIETSALVALADWQSREYEEERETSIYPLEFFDPMTSFGGEAAVGYRYVLKSGLSLSAQVTGTLMFMRNTFVSERINPEQFENELTEFRLGGSLLTLGYVW